MHHGQKAETHKAVCDWYGQLQS